MRIVAVDTPYFWHDGRGPMLVRWIKDDELLLPGSQAGRAPLAGSIEGVQYDADGPEGNWVIFHGMQVIQIVPEEVHAGWHWNYLDDSGIKTGVWEVEDSEWLKTFHPRHLGCHKHYIVEFYDEIVELICRELIFGDGRFAIEKVVVVDSRFAYAYLRRAMSQEKLGNKAEAIEYYQKYIDMVPDEDKKDYARRCINFIRTGSVETKQTS